MSLYDFLSYSSLPLLATSKCAAPFRACRVTVPISSGATRFARLARPDLVYPFFFFLPSLVADRAVSVLSLISLPL